MTQQKLQMDEALAILELPLNSWPLHPKMSPDQAKYTLAIFKKLIKKQQRNLVKRYHPDIPKNGPNEELKMKKINSVMDMLMKIEIIITPPKPKPIQFRFYSFGQTFGASSQTSTNYYN